MHTPSLVPAYFVRPDSTARNVLPPDHDRLHSHDALVPQIHRSAVVQ